jgi:AcrR family transcriptional regulator
LRDRLLIAAKELFAEKGYAATSTREIAARAGCNLSLIAHYFGSKEGLLRELISSRVKVVQDELRALSVSTAPLREKLARWVTFLVRTMGEDRDFTQLFHREVSIRNDAFLQDFKPLAQATAGVFIGMLEEARARGELRPDLDPKIAAMLLVGMVQFYFVNYAVTSQVLGPATPELAEQIRAHVLAIFEHGALA